MAIFKEGLTYYYQKDFEHAKACFQSILTPFKEDVVARIYLERCEHYQQGVPDDWDGASVAQMKQSGIWECGGFNGIWVLSTLHG